ncbi:hypothetical protein C8F04DRAFT_1403976 [Mycena alexandri]|uniref:Uncharacterized protein n=1 Tax=Mycena alexandri TaxID=1745969 RepID=A0AAD6WLT1_9AGAR|nr:hypothetical protein C8F04DRAFT_1054427 [Mycena alexandri]KAJ7019972.1 hypothetical protein C8F04DRAFT_1403976 [Mycena alexandri]
MPGPIKLKTWVPRNTKPAWDWKAKKSRELEYFDVPFAIKEYVQNCVGQILKDLQRREWSDWNREDLRGKTLEERQTRKRWLTESYPGLLTGPHGISLTKDVCLPLYILSADIPIPSKTNLLVAIVLWSTDRGMNALTFFNNHLDANATFTSFAVDGESTSKDNTWAVGEKGKGFILATQFLAETIDEQMPAVQGKPSVNVVQAGISFRVGYQIGELKWKTSRRVGMADSLRVILDDLTVRSPSEYLTHRYHLDIDDAFDGGDPGTYDPSMETGKMRDKAATILKAAQKQRVKHGLEGADNKSLVHADEVCIVVIGLDVTAKPEYLFSAIYGIMPPAREWRNPGGNIQFFLANPGPKFYHRDQWVRGGIHLNRLSINYHGNLNLTSDRVMVHNDRRMAQYRVDVCNNVDHAFRTLPDLAIELALDILTDDHSDAIAGILVPRDKAGAAPYRVAFEAALQQRVISCTGAAPTLPLHPYAQPDETLKLFAELGLIAVQVSYKALEIIHHSGAYAPIKEYARSILLAAPPLDDFPGLDRLRAALQLVLPRVPSESITLRQYDKVYPTVAWDDENKLFAFALPKPCEEHPQPTQCVCWIGPVLHDAAKEYEGPKIPAAKLWRAFALQMGGDTTIKPGAGSASQKSGSETSAAKPPVAGKDAQAPAAKKSASPSKPTVAAAPTSHSTPTSGVQASEGAEALNRQALAQLSQAVLGYDAFKEYDVMASKAHALHMNLATQQERIESLTSTIDKKDGKIMELEEENKILLEDLTEQENAVLKRRAEREFKRRRTA